MFYNLICLKYYSYLLIHYVQCYIKLLMPRRKSGRDLLKFISNTITKFFNNQMDSESTSKQYRIVQLESSSSDFIAYETGLRRRPTVFFGGGNGDHSIVLAPLLSSSDSDFFCFFFTGPCL